jgi:uncharacterized membrane protein YedE/YeeE
MDLSFLTERFGEGPVLAAGGLGIGMLFGFFGQKSRFCLRAAVIEFARGAIGVKVAVWLLTFGCALAGTQLLVATGLIDVSEARQLAARGSLSGALIGGALFGVGMVLTRGCASRLLVLSANGNLRALLSGLVFAVTAQASYQGLLSPAREWLAGLWTVEGGPARDVAALIGLPPSAKLVFALVWLAGAGFFAWRSRLFFWGWFGALGVGAMIAAGWWFTWTVAQASFDPVSLKSLTFSGPSAEVLMLVLSPPGNPVGFDIALVPGVFLGSFIAAALSRELRLEGFRDGHAMRRYIAGAVAMGFGAMLAGGCAVGAGVTGGSIFAVTAWLALVGMWAAAALTDLLVDRLPEMRAAGAARPDTGHPAPVLP